MKHQGLREIALDTETTGLDAEGGDRIIEIGAVEMIDKVRTGREFHVLVDPQCDISLAAQQVHGITREMLNGKPLFRDAAGEFLDFIGDDPLVIHNADFDTKFLNKELERAGLQTLRPERIIDSVLLARTAFPGSPASLDALCRRFKISLDRRDKHGALIDAQLLAEVYLCLNGGRQRSLELLGTDAEEENSVASGSFSGPKKLHIVRANEEELQAHAALLAKIPDPVWNRASK